MVEFPGTVWFPLPAGAANVAGLRAKAASAQIEEKRLRRMLSVLLKRYEVKKSEVEANCISARGRKRMPARYHQDMRRRREGGKCRRGEKKKKRE